MEAARAHPARRVADAAHDRRPARRRQPGRRPADRRRGRARRREALRRCARGARAAGGREGADAAVPTAGRCAGRPVRPRPGPAGAVEPRRQFDQVHAGRRLDHRQRAGRGGAAAVRRERHGSGIRPRCGPGSSNGSGRQRRPPARGRGWAVHRQGPGRSARAAAISVDSADTGGTTFSFTLPIVHAASAPAASAQTTASAPAASAQTTAPAPAASVQTTASTPAASSEAPRRTARSGQDDHRRAGPRPRDLSAAPAPDYPGFGGGGGGGGGGDDGRLRRRRRRPRRSCPAAADRRLRHRPRRLHARR